MRFDQRNWNKFFDGSNKKTTIRVRKNKIGHHKAYTGSYYIPQLIGEFDIVKIEVTFFKNLTEQDAKDDGFDTLPELHAELFFLNGEKVKNSVLYKFWIENPETVKQCK